MAPLDTSMTLTLTRPAKNTSGAFNSRAKTRDNRVCILCSTIAPIASLHSSFTFLPPPLRQSFSEPYLSASRSPALHAAPLSLTKNPLRAVNPACDLLLDRRPPVTFVPLKLRSWHPGFIQGLQPINHARNSHLDHAVHLRRLNGVGRTQLQPCIDRPSKRRPQRARSPGDSTACTATRTCSGTNTSGCPPTPISPSCFESSLGMMTWRRVEPRAAAGLYRRAIALAESATEEDRSTMVFFPPDEESSGRPIAPLAARIHRRRRPAPQANGLPPCAVRPAGAPGG
ncbi:hypothetical protein BDK51DRAFT_46391 [Blyttiomyces helicus]|uniref:Uncharacterized protein n=1 Tax=Blyttiomyces helicus TaxID=388810 RepID=A0A4V1IQD3_9FUNG|nr:hypothetical protein BDK51DRAFT_46391 [Blyttiomyces helicus]|eukprot:RKO86157.1 hypothetical protein BDK51DRAFT_46391 [Blyttiomyces helicus]